MCALRILIFTLLVGASGWASEFDDANQLYDAGKFAEAKQAYDRLVERGEWTANLFYNLGNAEFRVNNPGAAMLDYERALTLESSHAEARANLLTLRNRTGAASWPASWLDAVFPGRWVSAYVVVAALAGWLTLALLLSIFSTPAGEKSGRWFAFAMALIVTAYAGVAVWHLERSRALAIIVAKVAEVRLAPAETAASGGLLQAGSEVRVLSVRGDWTYCALPEQRLGWIASKALERVRLGAS